MIRHFKEHLMGLFIVSVAPLRITPFIAEDYLGDPEVREAFNNAPKFDEPDEDTNEDMPESDV